MHKTLGLLVGVTHFFAWLFHLCSSPPPLPRSQCSRAACFSGQEMRKVDKSAQSQLWHLSRSPPCLIDHTDAFFNRSGSISRASWFDTCAFPVLDVRTFPLVSPLLLLPCSASLPCLGAVAEIDQEWLALGCSLVRWRWL